MTLKVVVFHPSLSSNGKHSLISLWCCGKEPAPQFEEPRFEPIVDIVGRALSVYSRLE